MSDVLERLAAARIVAIVSVGDVEGAVALVDDLAAAGVETVEILFRNADAPKALVRCRARHPEMLLAAGTIVTADLCRQAVEAGADLMISPGLTPALAAASRTVPLPLIAGVQTASEVMAAAELGLRLVKFYPAEPNGAPAILRDYANVFPAMRFVPTGGIGEAQLAAYGALKNVAAVGGSWLHAGLDPGPERVTILTQRVARAKGLMGADGS
ncbi:bifunctional 4-hydroxy-2-oxoglutarate aldolase/2-dehydro-3-deoxy-phosphogluconate aldolase [Kaistia algarum]|uniref:bifunctional 4-hydroxy-2-oxoglutarate aldolase/2-dehydro-3-deoxy-phosphogluconate aldolase n=1 Tax=Kaistia algarum TaxID=2083279 RepID=UPI001403C976|nr:bifunctional 4-hydroxy-2-oxoglutarate aldolase/2-dehydro-3-deoxy-phosphogluconate aldolase [Kaistia algarum]MCX5512921.1 bifunctional 4-hydroxy-2-oxoglutarate aldolase/2-dehydro-3-deoxy-phosphogluconate aldolase [Kaistia algarum]